MTAISRVAAGVLCAFLLAHAGPARAHAIVVQSQPQQGASVSLGDMTATVTFSERIDVKRSRFLLVDDTQASLAVPIAEGDSPTRVTATLHIAHSGAYRLRWQVLAIDGHVTRGDILFSAK
ncbi:MAG TPA: copper resistance CopC family protein [Dongiaceae bacterium]|jgi:hypothetical protein|nr:copper resistance CopC family protein [Dongiaceae bacterium]